ncbi:hypothetical protein MACH09_42750 [Vibrio sp. MACH09]|nr:hypothetical protein MACH09_42750 [Vibrio sp. MACH09]
MLSKMEENEKDPQRSTWWVYLIRTQNRSLYCGITTDIPRRFKMHQQGKGAKYLRGKGPLVLEWSQQLDSQSNALRLEYQIKQFSKKNKERIIAEQATLSIK